MATTLGRFHGWLPSGRAVYNAFVENLWLRVQRLDTVALSKPVEDFGDAIRKSPVMFSLFNNTLRLASQPQAKQINSLDQFLALLETIINEPPKFQTAEGVVAEPVGVPMFLVFDILSNTSTAHDLFRMAEFNNALRPVLDHWRKFLDSDKSTGTLNKGSEGWFSDTAIRMLELDRGPFNQTYFVPDAEKETRGYTSWDKFFTRKVLEDARPLEILTGYEKDRLVFNACESTVERWRSNVKMNDRYWLKGMHYSLHDIFEDKSIAEQFVGGTIYQAFLSPQDYHRWHSPIDGKIVSKNIILGTYYAALPDKGVLENETVDPRGALIRSQPWLTMAATRAIIIIEGNANFGRVAFIGVGMAEVSSCDITVEEGEIVKAGGQLGMFHFGGSSHALIFNRKANVRLMTEEGVVKEGRHIQVNKAIGVSVAK